MVEKVLVEPVVHPVPFRFVPGKAPVWQPKEYRFDIPQGPTGFARVRHYWNAHWRAVAKEFLTPIIDLYEFVCSILAEPEVTRPVAVPPLSGEAVILESDLEKQYSAVFAGVIKELFLPDQDEACRLLGEIITGPALAALDTSIIVPFLIRGSVAPEWIEDYLMELLPGLTETLKVDRREIEAWKTAGYEKLEGEGVRDLLTFRERAICMIADYLGTIIPVAHELFKAEQDEGVLESILKMTKDGLPESGEKQKEEETPLHRIVEKYNRKLKGKRWWPEKTLNQHLVERLPVIANRFDKESTPQYLLVGLAQFLKRSDQLVDRALSRQAEKLFGKRAIDAFFVRLIPKEKNEEDAKGATSVSEEIEEIDDNEGGDLDSDKKVKSTLDVLGDWMGIGQVNILTDSEDGAIDLMIRRIVRKLTDAPITTSVLTRTANALGIRQSRMNKVLHKLISKEDPNARACQLDLTVLIPTLKLMAYKARNPSGQRQDHSELVDKFFAQPPTGTFAMAEKVGGFTALKSLREVLSAYPLILNNLMQLLIHDAITYFY